MPRKKLIRSDCFPYHVTARANNKEPFPIALPILWKIMTDELLLLTVTHEVEIQAFVLMPNHFHLLISTPKTDLGKVMNLYISSITRIANLSSGRSGHIFGGPYFWSIITSTRYYGHALKYIYRNPIRAKLCERVEEYEFSTFQGLVGMAHLAFPLSLTRLGMEINLPEIQLPLQWVEWLNRPFPIDAEKIIQKAFWRKEITEVVHRSNRRPCQELAQFL